MDKLRQFQAAKVQLISRYPAWQSFIDELIYRLKPIYLDEHDRDKVRFIHLIGFSSRATALQLLREILQLLHWQDESVFLLSHPGSDDQNKLELAREFQKTHRFFPQVLVTDYLNGLLTNLHLPRTQTCREFPLVESFLLGRKMLELTFQQFPASYSAGSLIIHYLDSFKNDEARIFEMYRLIREKQILDPERLKKEFVPKDLSQALEMDYLREDELLFFAEEHPALIQLSFDLVRVVENQEQSIAQLIGMQTSFSQAAVKHYIQKLNGEILNFSQLEKAFQAFLNPVREDLQAAMSSIPKSVYSIQLDHQNEWLFHFKLKKSWKEEIF